MIEKQFQRNLIFTFLLICLFVYSSVYLYERNTIFYCVFLGDNVMIMPGYNQVKLIDFDTLKKESVRAVSGTHGYAAPEVHIDL